jgi:integrase
VKLEVGTTKNKDGRLVVLPAELRDIIQEQRARTSSLERQQRRIIPWVFHRNGEPIKDFRVVWANACHKAAHGTRHFHDFRRTGIRNMIRRGITEPVAMKISGHKTADVFRRYNITTVDDLREAAHKMSGIVPGIVPQNPGEAGGK